MSVGMVNTRLVVTEYDLAVMRYLVRAARRSFCELSVSSSLEAINELFCLGVALVRRRVRRGRYMCVIIRRGGLFSREETPAQMWMIQRLRYLRKVAIVRCGLEDLTGSASI
jgi:hypothetical protein